MRFFQTIAHFRQLAAARKVTGALVVSVLGDLVDLDLGGSKRASHADQHMKNEGIFGHGARDDHLYGEWGARQDSHSMFLSPEDSILAITAALNTPAGADALANLSGKAGGINLCSRTAAALIQSAVERKNDLKKFHDFQVDYIVVGLVDGKFVLGPKLKSQAPGTLVINTAYPVATGGVSASADKDWWTFNAGNKLPHPFDTESPPIAPWDLDEHTPGSLSKTWVTL